MFTGGNTFFEDNDAGYQESRCRRARQLELVQFGLIQDSEPTLVFSRSMCSVYFSSHRPVVAIAQRSSNIFLEPDGGLNVICNRLCRHGKVWVAPDKQWLVVICSRRVLAESAVSDVRSMSSLRGIDRMSSRYTCYDTSDDQNTRKCWKKSTLSQNLGRQAK